jgi:hypothetical protein
LCQSRSSKEDNQKNADALNLHALRPNENKMSDGGRGRAWSR